LTLKVLIQIVVVNRKRTAANGREMERELAPSPSVGEGWGEGEN
jgi:hypothetical protein